MRFAFSVNLTIGFAGLGLWFGSNPVLLSFFSGFLFACLALALVEALDRGAEANEAETRRTEARRITATIFGPVRNLTPKDQIGGN